MASTHPGLLPGGRQCRTVLRSQRDRHSTRPFAKQRLCDIQPRVADIAERLATVEHVDHLRFRTEFQPNIFNDIFTLYALNEGQTYRYSVSSAGAGGMVQMIPSTYNTHPQPLSERGPDAGFCRGNA